MIKLRSKSFSRSGSKLGASDDGGGRGGKGADKSAGMTAGEIKWELRPGGMLVQKRECEESTSEGIITIKVSTVSQWHDISVQATSTFGELKNRLSLLTNLEPQEQRLLFKGKEREDHEYLHMVGIKEKDKVLLLEDPAARERKLRSVARDHVMSPAHHTISV